MSDSTIFSSPVCSSLLIQYLWVPETIKVISGLCLAFKAKVRFLATLQQYLQQLLRPLNLATSLGGDTQNTVAFELSFSLLYSCAKQHSLSMAL